jgi:G patch domain-containing protein 2
MLVLSIGDDEQSDFFHEAGPECGIVPWWENNGDMSSTSKQHNPSFETILKGTFEHMSSAARRNYQARLMMAPVCVMKLCFQVDFFPASVNI